MADPITEAASDPVEARDEAQTHGLVGELDYARSVAAALAHAAKPRPGPAQPPWVGIGPRNIGGRIISLVQDPAQPLTLYAGSAHGGLWRTQDGGDSWAHIDVGPRPYNGPVGALAVHPSDSRMVYVGTGAVRPDQASGDGLFRLSFQANGVPHTDRLASAPGLGEAPLASANGAAARYTRIEVDPDEPQRFWAASNTGLWRCTAVGLAPAAPVVAWVRDFPQGPGVPAAAPNLVSQAGLGIESRFPAYVTDLRVARDPRSTETVLRADGRRLLRFLVLYVAVQEAGVFRGRYDRQLDTVVWDALPTLVPNAPGGAAFGRVLLALCRSRPTHVYTVFETFDGDSRASTIVATEDAGDTWRQRGRIPLRDNQQAFFSMVLEVNPDDPRILACGTVNLALSMDGGTSFQPILEWEHHDQGDHAQHADQHALVFDALDRRRLWLGNDGGIALARDITRPDGAAAGYWRKRSHGINAGQFQDVTVHRNAALNFISAGGLQDNGSWVGYGGPTWYHVGPADGGGIAVHATNPRQFLISQQTLCALGTVCGALPAVPDAPVVGVDPVTRIPAVQLFTVSAPVLNDLPLADVRMRVRRDRYLPFRRMNEAALEGPFVGLLEQDPRVANAGQALYGFRFGNVGSEVAPALLLHQTVALVLAPPPGLAALPTAPAAMPAPPQSASELPLALGLLQRVAFPAPALALGDEASSLAFGPDPGAAPPLVEGWLGTARGRLFHTNDAPRGSVANPWADVAQLTTPSSAGPPLVHAAVRLAVHPANPAVVAAAALPADREFFVVISTAGIPADLAGGAARCQVVFVNPDGSLGAFQPPVAANSVFTALAGTGLFLAFPDAAGYTLNQAWRINLDGRVLPGRPMVAFGRLPVEARITITGAGAPHRRNTPGGAAAGIAQYQVELRVGPGFGPPSAAGDCEFDFSRMQASTMFLRFTAGNYFVGDSWIVAVDARVRPAATLNVLPAFNQAFDLRIVAAGAVGVASFNVQLAGMPAAGPAIATAIAVDVPGTGVVLHFSGGPFVAGHHWRIGVDNAVVAVGAVAGNVEVLGRLRGRVFLSHDRGAHWADVSFPRTRPAAGFDADSAALPPGPVTSLCFDAQAGGTDLYVGTLAGVYAIRGVPLAAPVAPAVLDLHWRPFNGPAGQALPPTLVNDLELVTGTRRLRAATFGRGLWDNDLANALPRRQLVIRQTLVEDGLAYPRPFPFPALLPDDPRVPAGTVWLDHAHAFDIRVDSAPFKFFDDVVDGVEFDEELGVDVLQPLARQAVYVQVHNRGWDAVNDVDVHLLFAPAGVDGSLPMAPAVLAAPATSMPALAAPVAEVDALGAPAFNPTGASPWRRVAAARRVPVLRPWEPVVLRFDWQPPADLAVAAPNNHVALLAISTAADDALPAPAAGEKLPAFIARERRAALRLVPIAALPAAQLSIRDGVDDDARAGGVAFVGRSPDLIAVASAPADPTAAFADLLDTRPADSLRLNAGNALYVRVHNSGLAPATAEVHLWAVALDGLQAPSFAPGTWQRLTPAVAPFLTVVVPAQGTALAHQAWANPPDPAPASPLKAIALVALIRSTDNTDPLPDPTAAGVITNVQQFWDFFDKPFNADNAALRVLPVQG